jgi:hypothetical protein
MIRFAADSFGDIAADVHREISSARPWIMRV